MQREHFYPTNDVGYQSFNDFKSQYEGVKAAHEADITTIENCLGKCNINFKGGVNFEDREGACLRKCFVKYFDSALLIEKEMRHFVHGQNM